MNSATKLIRSVNINIYEQIFVSAKKKTFSNTDEINANTFTECCLFVIAYPKAKFSQNEVCFYLFNLKNKNRKFLLYV